MAASQPPPGWTEEQRVEGDLDGDGRSDRVLVLVGGDGETSGARALVVQLADDKGGYRDLVVAPRRASLRFLYGALGGTGTESYEVAVEEGKLLLWWSRGSREMVEVSLTFAYDAERGSMRLVRDEVIRIDRVEGDEQVSERDWLDPAVALPYRQIQAVKADDY